MYSEEIKHAAEMIDKYIKAYIQKEITFDEALNKAEPYYRKIFDAYFSFQIENLVDVKDLAIGDKTI